MKFGKNFALIYSPCFIKLGVGSCSTSYFCLVMQITSYEDKTFRRAYNTHADFQGEISEKKLRIFIYTRVDRFVCNILDMIHLSNSVL